MTSWIKKTTLLGLVWALSACSNGNSNSATALVDATGKHPSGWVQQHWTLVGGLSRLGQPAAASAALAAKLSCLQCHGSDLQGGISKVSCFTQAFNGQACHFTVLGHPTDWKSALRHGQGQMLTGAGIPAEQREQGGGAMSDAGPNAGFAYCAGCHGSDFRGNGQAVSCFSCHTSAPHATSWIGGTVNHKLTSPSEAAICLSCHAGGSNFGTQLPGSADPGSPALPAPDCFNTSLCHGAVPAPHAESASYLQKGAHGADAVSQGLGFCKSCHADQNGRFDRAVNNMPGGCESAGCHAPQTAHPTPWLPGRSGSAGQVPAPANPNTTTHAGTTLAAMSSGCTLCHGAALDGVGAKGSAPSCTTGNPQFGISCHAASPQAHPAGCTSCHPSFVASKPNNGTADAHSVHLALPGVSCDACHTGGGVDPATGLGGARHANAAGYLNVSSARYWGRNGGFRFNRDDLTCANVRCHGGQTTPPWTSTGVISVNLDCLKCHEQGDAGNTPQTPEFNSFYSGSFAQTIPAVNLHQFHLDPNNRQVFPNLPVFCTDCHSLTTQQHFGGLALIGFQSTPGNTPGDTIKLPGSGVYFRDPLTGSYPGTCSNVSCHTVASKNASWGK